MCRCPGDVPRAGVPVSTTISENLRLWGGWCSVGEVVGGVLVVGGVVGWREICDCGAVGVLLVRWLVGLWWLVGSWGGGVVRRVGVVEWFWAGGVVLVGDSVGVLAGVLFGDVYSVLCVVMVGVSIVPQ